MEARIHLETPGANVLHPPPLSLPQYDSLLIRPAQNGPNFSTYIDIYIYIKAKEITYSQVWRQHSSLSAGVHASCAPNTSHFPANSRAAL